MLGPFGPVALWRALASSTVALALAALALYGGTLASVAAPLESSLDARRAAALFAAAASAAPLLAALSQGLLP